MKPRFFATPSLFRAWLEENHASAKELLVGFYKRDSGKSSITWPESVDQALCFGWIDGVRHSLDDTSYTIRFTPRRPRSSWSLVNITRVRELIRLRLMRRAGLAAFEARADERAARYSYEQMQAASLDAESERRFRADKKAWSHFEAQAPGYRRKAAWWVMSAKKAETRASRLAQLIENARRGRPIGQLARPARQKAASPRSRRSKAR